MIESRQYVPDHYEKSRDFQVFLKIVDLVVNAAKAELLQKEKYDYIVVNDILKNAVCEIESIMKNQKENDAK